MGLFGRGDGAGATTAGSQGIAQVKMVTATKRRKDDTTWTFALLVRREGKPAFNAQIEQTLPNSVGTPEKWLQVPVIYDPNDVRDWRKTALDVSRLSAVDLTQPLPPDPAAAPVANFGGGTPKWIVPHHCPNCGGIVDQVAAERSADPKCSFCGEPLPVSH